MDGQMQSGGRRRAKAHRRCAAHAMSGRVMVADDNHEVKCLGSNVGDAVAPQGCTKITNLKVAAANASVEVS